MSFFSKRNNFKLGVTLSAFAALVSACGGGGGGGASSPPPPPPRSEFIAVTSVNPADKAIDIDAQLPGITVTFSENIDPSSFIKESSALGKLIAAKSSTAGGDTVIEKLIDQAGATVDVITSNYTLAQVKANNLSIVGKCVNIVEGARSVINGTLKITGYRFVGEETTGLHSLHLFVENCSEPFTWTSQQLIDSGLVNNSMFKVELISGTTSTALAAMGQISVSGKSVTFTPVNFLEWSSESKAAEYRVTVKRHVVGGEQGIKELLPAGSTDSVRTIQADFVSTFKTKVLPDAKVVSTAPNGIDASPVAVIKAVTNFKVDLASMNENTVKLERINRTSNDPAVPVTRTQVQATLAYDVGQSQIVITPVGDLRYLQDYEVTLVGGSSGLRGSQGNVLGRTMVADHKFGFTTSEAKVMSITSSNTVPTSATGEATTFKIKLNFKPDASTIPAGVSLLNESTGMVIPFTSTVSNDEITVKPNSGLVYGQTYKVTVTPDLKSQELRGLENANELERIVSISAPVSTSITMETRKLVDAVPTLRSSIGEKSSIVLTFNFDISNDIAANFNTSSSVVKVQQLSLGSSSTPSVTVRRTAARVIEILAPSSGYPFQAELTVTVNFPSMDGQILTVTPLVFKVAPSNTLAINGYTPAAGTGIGLNSEISVTFSHQLKALTSSQLNSSSSDAAIKLYLDGSSSSCQYSSGSVGGRITYDTNKIYFLPSAGLKSWCKYKVTIDPNLVSVDGRTKSTSSSWTWEFTAHGLQVNNVYVTYAYGTSVSVRQPIEITFNYDLSYFQWSDAVILTERNSGSRVSVSTSVFRNEFTLDPYSDLKHDT